MAHRVPQVYVIAGPNGAGKTTFATEFLPEFVKCRQFLNADLIAAGLSPFAPETQNAKAGRLLLERIRELSSLGDDFGFETTLAGRSYARLLKRLKERGYQITLFFLWLPSAELAVSRVRNRVRQGGHDIPDEVIRRRFRLGIANFHFLYRPLADIWSLYNAAEFPPTTIVKSEYGNVSMFNEQLYAQIRDSVEPHRP
jgi:predicted ABC-type ATPase